MRMSNEEFQAEVMRRSKVYRAKQKARVRAASAVCGVLLVGIVTLPFALRVGGNSDNMVATDHMTIASDQQCYGAETAAESYRTEGCEESSVPYCAADSESCEADSVTNETNEEGCDDGVTPGLTLVPQTETVTLGTGALTVMLNNGTDDVFVYAPAYLLERQENGSWSVVSSLENGVETAATCSVPPWTQQRLTLRLDDYADVLHTAGQYRLTVRGVLSPDPEQQLELTATFVVE